jgi:hypothetical protein
VLRLRSKALSDRERRPSSQRKAARTMFGHLQLSCVFAGQDDIPRWDVTLKSFLLGFPHGLKNHFGGACTIGAASSCGVGPRGS